MLFIVPLSPFSANAMDSIGLVVATGFGADTINFYVPQPETATLDYADFTLANPNERYCLGEFDSNVFQPTLSSTEMADDTFYIEISGGDSKAEVTIDPETGELTVTGDDAEFNVCIVDKPIY